MSQPNNSGHVAGTVVRSREPRRPEGQEDVGNMLPAENQGGDHGGVGGHRIGRMTDWFWDWTKRWPLSQFHLRNARPPAPFDFRPPQRGVTVVQLPPPSPPPPPYEDEELPQYRE